MNLHPRLLQEIESTVKELTTIEKDYYSASKLGVDEEMAQKIIGIFIRRIPCQYHLEFIEEEVFPHIYLDDSLEEVSKNDSGI